MEHIGNLHSMENFVGRGAGGRTLRVGGSEATLGRSAPLPRLPGGGPHFSREMGRKRAGGKPPGPHFYSRSFPLAGFGDCWFWYGRGAISSGMLRPIWDAFSRENMLESIFVKNGFQIRLIPPKPSPWGEGAPVRTLGRMRGRFRTQPFLVESLRGSRQSPQRNFSPAPLGKSIAPSSVTFGDSFPPRGSLWVVQPYPKKRPKSGHADGCRNSPSTGTMWHPTPKRASTNERALKKGGRGATPRDSLRPGFL